MISQLIEDKKMKTDMREVELRPNELNVIALLSGLIREYNENVNTLNDVSDLIIKTANQILDLPQPHKPSLIEDLIKLFKRK